MQQDLLNHVPRVELGMVALEALKVTGCNLQLSVKTFERFKFSKSWSFEFSMSNFTTFPPIRKLGKKVSLSLVNGAFGANGDNEWRQ